MSIILCLLHPYCIQLGLCLLWSLIPQGPSGAQLADLNPCHCSRNSCCADPSLSILLVSPERGNFVLTCANHFNCGCVLHSNHGGCALCYCSGAAGSLPNGLCKCNYFKSSACYQMNCTLLSGSDTERESFELLSGAHLSLMNGLSILWIVTSQHWYIVVFMEGLSAL